MTETLYRFKTQLLRVTAPVTPVVSLEEARDHLRVDATGSPASHPDDTMIEAMVAAATSEIDGADGSLGRALITQTWRMSLEEFPIDSERGSIPIKLPLTSPKVNDSPAPEIVTSITYRNSSGTETELSTDLYRVICEADPILVAPALNTTWPSTSGEPDAVQITYQAGYGDEGSDVPEMIRRWILMRVGQFYACREMVTWQNVQPMPWMEHCLVNFKLHGVIR